MLEELFGNVVQTQSVQSVKSVSLEGIIYPAIVADKTGNRQFKAAVQTRDGWLVCEGGQLRGAVKRLRELGREKGYNLETLDILSKADFSARFGGEVKQGPAVQSVPQVSAPKPEIKAQPKAERSPVAPHVPTIRPPAFQAAPAQAPIQQPALGLFAQLEAKPAQGPAQGAKKDGRKWTPGRRLETCYQWAAALSDAAKRVGASPEGQRNAYKAAYVAAFKAGCVDGDPTKAEKFASQVNVEFSLDQIKAEIERAGVPLAKLIEG